MILAEAVRYFSEGGWDSGTEGLARRLDVTQPLLFRYFPTKEALIARIYKDLMRQIWDPTWENLIQDTRIPLESRLVAFYRQYSERVLSRENFRLFMYAGLAKYQHGMRYFPALRKHIFPAIARALRAELGLAPRAHSPETEIEIAQSLHAAIYHLAVRRWIYVPRLRGDIDHLIELKVTLFLKGARAVLTGMNTLSDKSRRV